VIFRPLQHLFDLRPVGNIVKFNQTQRRAGDDQTVKVLVANIVEVAVEVIQVFTWRIADSRASIRRSWISSCSGEFDSRRRN
jgi:hypothetical protein